MLVLLRGIPGSGKSTAAKTFEGFKHFEADMYFVESGIYEFDASKIKYAHAWCQDQARKALRCGENVVVSNTLTKMWEIQPYLDMAEDYSHELQVYRCLGDHGSVHNVPDAVIQRMLSTYEPHPEEERWRP